MFERCAGVLLHPTSLLNDEGIGTFGASAYGFVDWLAESGVRLWQVLPLGPTGYGDSPYAAFSVFAGNPLLIDVLTLQNDGFVSADEYEAFCRSVDTKDAGVQFSVLVEKKIPLLKDAGKRFLKKASKKKLSAFKQFCKEQASWLESYVLFMNIKAHYDKKARQEAVDGAMWNNYWSKDLAHRDESALKKWYGEHSEEIEIEKVLQFFFFEQWFALKNYANKKNIKIIGDVPIFTANDCADVWEYPHFFHLDEDGKARLVAGVPPDCFNADGQLWGNPLYNWDEMRADNFSWWRRRMQAMFDLYDYVRIDHFRGFDAAWAVKAGAETAKDGEWVPAYGEELFHHIIEDFRQANPNTTQLPIIVEDLGFITAEVEALRDSFNLPGMKILQFAFDENKENPFLPHLYPVPSIAYTGTHDNPSLLDWLKTISVETLNIAQRYVYDAELSANIVQAREKNSTDFDRFAHCFAWDLIHALSDSQAMFAIIPMQDILCCDASARMNTPGSASNNWTWRMKAHDLEDMSAHAKRLRSLLQNTNRV